MIRFLAPILLYLAIIVCATLAKAEDYNYNLNTSIEQTNTYGLEKMLDNAKSGDVILLNIDSGGGSLNTTMRIVEKMSKSKAKVSCTVNKLAASGAAVILMQCNSISVGEKAIVLFHTPYVPVSTLYGVLPYRELMVTSDFADYLNRNFCFRDAIGQNVYEKFLMGGDITFKKAAFEQMLSKSCFVKGDLVVFR